VVETRNFFATMEVDSLAPDVDPEGHMQVQQKPEETPVTLAAKSSALGRVYLDWAKYPVVEAEPTESGYIVRFHDLRFGYPGQNRRAVLSASVRLDKNLKVVRENFGSGGR
jgi:inner membrane protein